MKNNRLTLMGMMGVIVVISLMLAGLRHPAPLIASIAWTGVLTILIGAALVAVLDPSKTFWVGFSLVGLIFAGFASLPFQQVPIETPLLTTHLLNVLFPLVTPGANQVAIVFLDTTVSINENANLFEWSRRFVSFHRIGQSLAAFLHAIAGGLLALLIRSRNSDKTRQKFVS